MINMKDQRLLQRAGELGADGTLAHGRLGKRAGVLHYRRDDIALDHLQHSERLDVQRFGVVFQQDLVAGAHLRLAKHLVLGKEADVLLADQAGQRLGRGLQVAQAARFGLLDPLVRVVVAVEDDALVIAQRLDEQRCV